MRQMRRSAATRACADGQPRVAEWRIPAEFWRDGCRTARRRVCQRFESGECERLPFAVKVFSVTECGNLQVPGQPVERHRLRVRLHRSCHRPSRLLLAILALEPTKRPTRRTIHPRGEASSC